MGSNPITGTIYILEVIIVEEFCVEFSDGTVIYEKLPPKEACMIAQEYAENVLTTDKLHPVTVEHISQIQ